MSGVVLAVIVFELLDLRSEEEQLAAFIRASRRGDVEEVRALVDGGMDPGVRTPEGWTALHYAAVYGRADVVALLLERGAPADAKHPRGMTPLHRASEHGSVEVARMLVERGAPIDARAGERTALSLAIAKRHDRLVAYLIDQGADLGVIEPRSGLTPALYAVLVEDPALLEKVLDRGASPDDVLRNGESALHIAVATGVEDSLRLLLDHGAEPDARNATGNTPLHQAARLGSEAMVVRLLAAGAATGLANDAGERPVDLAHTVGAAGVERLLGEAGDERPPAG